MKRKFSEINAYTRFVNQSQFSTTYFTYIPSENSSAAKSFYEYQFIVVDTSFFKVFEFDFKYGSAANAFKDMNSVVLEAETAQKYFGDQNPVGEILNCSIP